MTDTRMRQDRSAEKAPIGSRVGQILATLRSKARKMWARHPEALELEARIVAIVSEETGGDGSIYCDPRSKAAWADVLEGARRMHVGDLARILVSRRPKGRAASQRVLGLISTVVGSIDAGQDLDIPGAYARSGAKAVELIASGAKALEDGAVSAAEVEILETKINHLENELISLRTALHARRKTLAEARA